MKNELTYSWKIFWLFSMLFPIVLYSNAQTVVEVIVNQPKKLEIVSNELFSRTANSIILGSNVLIEGGDSPYNYTWLQGSQPIGNSLVFEVPLNTPTNTLTLKVKDAKNCTCSKGTLTTGIHDLLPDSNMIDVYPNPSRDFVIINPHQIQGLLNVLIFDSKGTFILRKQIEGTSKIDLNLRSGLYFISIENVNKQIVAKKKIIVS
jgi:hypothetical protein